VASEMERSCYLATLMAGRQTCAGFIGGGQTPRRAGTLARRKAGARASGETARVKPNPTGIRLLRGAYCTLTTVTTGVIR
jgi:hypothetical protein